MKLKNHIKLVLDNSPLDTDIKFEVSLNADGSVAETETGNKVKFTVFNEDKVRVEKEKRLYEKLT